MIRTLSRPESGGRQHTLDNPFSTTYARQNCIISLSVTLLALIFHVTSLPPAAAQLDQTIQLPTFGFTTVATTVLVPDRGSVTLGGISRSRFGRTQRGTPLLGRLPFVGGPFNDVGIGSEISTSTMGVTAYIHDFEAMDQAIRAQAAELAPVSSRHASGLYPGEPYHVAVNPAALSVSEIRRRQEIERNTITVRQKGLLERARQAETEGRLSVAKIYYRSVWRDASGDIKKQLAAKLAELEKRRLAGVHSDSTR